MTERDDNDPLSTGGALGIFSDLADGGGVDIVGRTIGEYEVIELIAEGGMGRVYRATRVDGTFDRDVAIKVSAGSVMQKDLLERFVQEQKILASMEHPNVAQLFDAGTTDEGWPYIIMEFVDGLAIDEYVNERSCQTRDTVTLLLPVLDALAYAHARLIVHRDVKASNIIVDGAGVPRLLDFGIAKSLEPDKAALTTARPMSLISASPEQLLSEPVTIASDVYQVGLLLHRLLTGKAARSETSLREAIRDATDRAPFRLTADTRRELDSDLCAILTRCLQNDPAERYRDINALAADLRNYLEHRPVSVSPPTLVYRFGKLLQRNRLASAAVAALGLTLVVGTVFYTQGINQARLEAEQQAATAEEVISFLTDVFESSDPVNARGEEATAGELLASGARDIDERFPDRPLIRARLQYVISGVYREMEMFEDALPLAESAFELRDAELGADHPETLIAGNDLAIVYHHMGRYAEAIEMLEDVLARQRVVLGSDAVETMKSLNNLGATYLDSGDVAGAAGYLEEARERRLRVLGDEHDEYMSTLNNLGFAYVMLGDLLAGQQLFTEIVEVSRRTLGAEHPSSIIATINTAATGIDLELYDQARTYAEEARELTYRVYDEDARLTIAADLNWFRLLAERSDEEPGPEVLAEAEALIESVIERSTRSVGAQHRTTLGARANLATVRRLQGRTDEALEILDEVVAGLREILGESNMFIMDAIERRAAIYAVLGRYEEALAGFDAAAEFHADDLVSRIDPLLGRSAVLVALERPEQAMEGLDALLTDARQLLGDDNPKVGRIEDAISTARSAAGSAPDEQ